MDKPQEYSEMSISPSNLNEGSMVHLVVSLKSDAGKYEKKYSFDCGMGDATMIKAGLEAMMEIYTIEMKAIIDKLKVTGTREELNKFMDNPNNRARSNDPVIDVEGKTKDHIYEGFRLIDEVLKSEK